MPKFYENLLNSLKKKYSAASYFLLLFFTSSCSNYHYMDLSNPLAQYEIDSLYIPMFYNHSSLPNLSAEFTKEFYRTMTKFSDLKVYSGGKKNADAYLIGIISSPERQIFAKKTGSSRLVKGVAEDNIGRNRDNFKIPGSTAIALTVRVILIKNPTEADISLLQSSFGEQLPKGSQIVINDRINVRKAFFREIYDQNNVVVNYTQNRGQELRAASNMAQEAATAFKDMILYAF